jgi:hypothetical protein
MHTRLVNHGVVNRGTSNWIFFHRQCPRLGDSEYRRWLAKTGGRIAFASGVADDVEIEQGIIASITARSGTAAAGSK